MMSEKSFAMNSQYTIKSAQDPDEAGKKSNVSHYSIRLEK